ncbi:MAG: multi-sensor signal transduction histidine kinase, partial [Pedosphaera sp.]|nr:multi-sensor signal transduction histidine kinase [Pedosphaera sp.]
MVNCMGRPVKILIVEGCAEDADLMVFQLQRGGFDPAWSRVDNEQDYMTQLEQRPDAIIGNGSIPEFSSQRAIELLQARKLEIPFIFISSGNEDAAGNAKAHLRMDELGRLGSVLGQVLEQSRAWSERRKVEETLRKTEDMYRRAISSADAVPYLYDFKTGLYTFIGDGIWELTGYTAREINRDLWRRIIKDSVMQGEAAGLEKEAA